jgi:hypothetical protein
MIWKKLARFPAAFRLPFAHCTEPGCARQPTPVECPRHPGQPGGLTVQVRAGHVLPSRNPARGQRRRAARPGPHCGGQYGCLNGSGCLVSGWPCGLHHRARSGGQLRVDVRPQRQHGLPDLDHCPVQPHPRTRPARHLCARRLRDRVKQRGVQRPQLAKQAR